MISKQMSDNSCDRYHFDKASPDYNFALKNNIINDNVTYIPSQFKRSSWKRQNVLFNRPCNANVKTNVGKTFMGLIDQHFPPQNKYYKLSNKNINKLTNQVTVTYLSWILPSENIILNLWRIQHHLPTKIAIVIKKQTVIDASYFSDCIIYKASIQLLINNSMVLVEAVLQNVITNIYVLLEIRLMKRTLSCLSINEN